MNRYLKGVSKLAICAGIVAVAGVAQAHEDAVDDSLHDNKHLLHAPDNPDGHVPANINYGFTLIGQDTLGGIASGQYTDVWAKDGFAYVGTFQEPACDKSGVYIVDIRDPANPKTIKMLQSPANTRINDVKVHELDGRDVLFTTYEPCGVQRGGQANGDAKNGGKARGDDQKGVGGIGLYDVTRPRNPSTLHKFFLDSPIHNTFTWTRADGRSFTLAVDDVAANDLYVIETTDPTKPVLLVQTGIADWLADPTNPIADDGQLFTGNFAAPLLHDVWVEDLDPGEGENWVAVLPYWDAGFVTMDMNDPANPVFIDDSTYPEVDPVLDISPMEGNAHAAVFGDVPVASVGDTVSVIFGGDEDFDSSATTVKAGGATFTASQGSGTPSVGAGSAIESLLGTAVATGRACDVDGAVLPATDPTEIALVERGGCNFTQKVGNIEEAGYSAMIVFNSDLAGNCEASVSMLIDGNIPALFVPRSTGFALLGAAYDPNQCGLSDEGPTGDPAPAPGTIGLVTDVSGDFDGWGYLHVINNTGTTLTVKKGMTGMPMATTVEVPPMEHMGHYAPAEVADPQYATNAGDLTMHNIETDPTDRSRMFISWYSLGMRAVEWREGHLHSPDAPGQSVASWNMHEVGRWIEPEVGSNFWGVHVTQVNGEQYILGSDRNSGLYIFQWECVGEQNPEGTLYCEK